MSGPRILALIPARGGSKGVPRKNIKLLGGKPLLQYTTDAALKSVSITTVVLSTDDEEIAETGRSLGIKVPFMRPPELALDTTPTLPVVQHALRFMAERGEEFDAVCLLQPTSPLRTSLDIDTCIKKMFDENLDSIFSVLPVPLEHNPFWVYLENVEGLCELATGGTEPIPRRQLLPPAYFREGSIYVSRTSVILEQNSFYGKRVGAYKIETPAQINIDTMEDWAKAEKYFSQLQNQPA